VDEPSELENQARRRASNPTAEVKACEVSKEDSCAPFVLRLICEKRTDRKSGILNRQNEMQEMLCSLFPIDCRLPKLNVAGSIPVSRSDSHRGTPARRAPK
jgi:hypothetical protein